MSKRHRAARSSAPPAAAARVTADTTPLYRHPAATPFPRRKPRTPAQELASLGRVRQSLAVREQAAVTAARQAGMPWQDIADALGLPLTTVYRRFRP
jgi:DNA-directed RNA polymerase specialized sigma24 family protein